MNTRARITIRSGRPSDVRRLHALIAAHREEGHLLPRSLDDIQSRAGRFVVAVQRRRVVGCAEFATLGGDVAEVRSLAVDRSARGLGIGATLVAEIRDRARQDGFDQLCVFTHAPAYFSRMGFSIVPHLWLGEKVFTDCVKCPLFRRCGQYAMTMALPGVQPAGGTTEIPVHVAQLPVAGHSAIALRLA